MCFSATASFTAAAGLSTIGVITLREAKTRSQLPLAVMPLLFGIQQAVEGVVWISSGTPWLQAAASFTYLLFSHMLWPFYVPFAVGAIEPPGRRKTVLKGFFLVGVALSLWIASYIFSGPVTATLGACCVVYQNNLPPIPYVLAAYVFVTCFSCLISSHKYIRVLGFALMGALAISLWYYRLGFYSVWCFFSAILSGIIYAHLREGRGLVPAQVREFIKNGRRPKTG